MAVEEPIAAGNAALGVGRWDKARTAFAAALREHEAADALLGMGEALWWLGESRPSVECYERAYAELRRAGDATRAAWAAMWLSLTYKLDFGNQAAASGWIARAERALQCADPGPLQGWLWLTQAYETTDLAFSRELTERALVFARGLGDVDLELVALGNLGKVLVAMGQVEEGLRLVDEAMAGTLGGERSRLDTVVFSSCSMLAACELAADLERATQWCRVTNAFIRQYGCPFLHAECRTLYGGLLVVTGQWADAERELAGAIRMTRDAYPGMHALALVRLADLRLRQGRLEEAEALLSGPDDYLASALPTAMVRLARGESAVAVALLRRRLHYLGEQHLEAAPTLELLVGAYLAGGDIDAATETVARLSELARDQDRDHIVARAACAAARLSAVRGEMDAATGQLEAALERFSQLNLPLETARARLELARVLTTGHPAVAVADARIALAAFEQLGAAADADAAAALLRSLGATGRTGPKHVGLLTKREQEVLRLIGLGLSNPEIARRLVISRKTAAHHVSSVLTKLDLRNRAEAVAYTTRTFGGPGPNEHVVGS
jgi:ATP/maltotriose-dependent transcriptional regulator MalT